MNKGQILFLLVITGMFATLAIIIQPQEQNRFMRKCIETSTEIEICQQLIMKQ